MKGIVSALLALVPALAAAAMGESLPPADLQALLREAEAASPALRAAAARLDSARHVPSQAQAPPDPEVSLSYLNDGVRSFTLGESEFSTLSLTWTQEVPYPGKLDRRGEVATLEAESIAKDLERVRLEVGAAVKAAYADLYRLDRTAILLNETRAVLELLAQAARRRYEVGEGIQESVLKAQTEILRLETELARVAQDRRAAEVRLNAAVGRPTDVSIGPVTLLPEGDLPAETEMLAEAAVAASPAVAAREAMVRQGAAAVRLARLDLRPDFLWSASYQNRDGLDPMVMGMFGVRLPLYRKRKQAQALQQSESDLVAAREELADLEVRTRAEVRELVARVQRADRLVALIGQGVIPQARGALESAQASYGVGKIAFLDLLNDAIVLLNARIELAGQETDRLQALAALEPLLARKLVLPAGRPQNEGGQDGRDR